MREAGVQNFEMSSATVILAPGGTRRDVIGGINKALNKVLELPDVQSRLNSQGFEAAPASPEKTGAILAADVRTYARIIQEAGIHMN